MRREKNPSRCQVFYFLEKRIFGIFRRLSIYYHWNERRHPLVGLSDKKAETFVPRCASESLEVGNPLNGKYFFLFTQSDRSIWKRLDR